MLTVHAPAPDALDGDRLRAELAAAGITADFYLADDRLAFPDLADGDRVTVEGAVACHMDRDAPERGQSDSERIAVLEAEVRGIRERAAAATITNADARAVRDAVVGPNR